MPPSLNAIPNSAFTVIPIRGDGRCMFRSLIRGMESQERVGNMNSNTETAMADSLRESVADILRDAADHPRSVAYKHFKRTRQAPLLFRNLSSLAAMSDKRSNPELYITDIKKYAKSLREDPAGHWAGQLELLLLPNVIRRPIHVFAHPSIAINKNSGIIDQNVFVSRDIFQPSNSAWATRPPICIEHKYSNDGQGHYQLLLLRGGSPRATARSSNERIIDLLFAANRGRTATLVMNTNGNMSKLIRQDSQFRSLGLGNWNEQRVATFLLNKNRSNVVANLMNRNAPLLEWQVTALAAHPSR